MWWWLCLQSSALCGDWVHFPQSMTVCRWDWEWIKRSDWTPFRLEKVTDVDEAAKERKYSPSARFKAHFRTRVNLGLAFSCFPALKERLMTQSWPAFCWTGRCQTLVVSLLACWITDFSIKPKVILLYSLLCRYKQDKYTLILLLALSSGGGA